MRFLVDAQLPPALARFITASGHVGDHVADRGLLLASDDAIRENAVATGAVIVSKDEDFVRHQILAGGPPVVWVRLGNVRNRHLLLRFESELPRILDGLSRGESVLEVTE